MLTRIRENQNGSELKEKRSRFSQHQDEITESQRYSGDNVKEIIWIVDLFF